MEDFKTFYDRWRSQPQNIGKSFTRGSAFYDYMQWDLTFFLSDEREQIDRAVQEQYGLTQDQTDRMPYKAILELCDISILDEICTHLYFNDNEDENATE